MPAPLPLQTATVAIESGDVTIAAYFARPQDAAPYPTVVVIQEVFGVNGHIRSVTERIAALGYNAIAPHIYHRQAPHFEVGYREADLALGRQYKVGTRADELLADIQGAIAYVRQHHPQRGDGVGCIGFCFGGHVVYLAATLPAVQATASFYGAGITQMTPGGGPPTVSRTPEIQGTLYGFFGTADPLIDVSEVDTIERALQTAQVPHRIFRYEGASHGFFCDRRESYHPAAAEDAWTHTQHLFETVLG
jgi:carboxymethylenebutenolidase